jgi:DNA-binding response OmpR family regulator
MGRILVVDDDDKVRQAICDALELNGHEIVAAGNGLRALESFSAGAFDLVITDIVMPEKEGLETIIELRGLSPDLAILAISGGGSFVPGGYLKSALMLGADKALEKPFSLSLLLETVDELLDRPTPIAAATANGR